MKDPVSLGQFDPTSAEYRHYVRTLKEHHIAFITRRGTDSSRYTAVPGTEIAVERSEFRKARSLLYAVDIRLSNEAPSCCPHCKGTSVTRRIEHRLLGLLQRDVFRCGECGHQWRHHR